MEERSVRRHYIDNIRWATVLLVILYHVVYNFNSVGVITNLNMQGIPQLDVLEYFVYPWFMVLLFVAAGMSARYSLAARGGRAFARDRVKRLFVPSIAGIFLLGWIGGWVTSRTTDMFLGNGDMIPGIIKYFIYCMAGIGPLWFAHELFLASMILLLIRSIDKKDRLWELGGKANHILILLALALVVWGSAQILNTPLIEVYRHGIYIVTFLLGYFVFSHEEVTDVLVKHKLWLLAAAVLAGIGYTWYYFGENYASQEVLRSFFTNAYAWLMVLALFGCFKAWCDRENRYTRYLTKRNFGFYVLHYPLLVLISYLVVTYQSLPMFAYYLVILAAEILLLPLLYEIISSIPVIRFLILGISGKAGNRT